MGKRRRRERERERRGEGKEASKMNSIRLLFKSDHLFIPGQQSQSVSQTHSVSPPPTTTDLVSRPFSSCAIEMDDAARRAKSCAPLPCHGRFKVHNHRGTMSFLVVETHPTLISYTSGKVDLTRGPRRRREKGIALRDCDATDGEARR